VCLYPLYGSLPGPSQAPLPPPAAPLTPHPPLHPPPDAPLTPRPRPIPPWKLAAKKVEEQCRVVQEAEYDRLVAAAYAQAAVPMGTRK